MVSCDSCISLREEISGLKEFLTEWFVVLLHKFEAHDKNLHDLTDVLYKKFSVEKDSIFLSSVQKRAAPNDDCIAQIQSKKLKTDIRCDPHGFSPQSSDSVDNCLLGAGGTPVQCVEEEGPLLNHSTSLTQLLNRAYANPISTCGDSEENQVIDVAPDGHEKSGSHSGGLGTSSPPNAVVAVARALHPESGPVAYYSSTASHSKTRSGPGASSGGGGGGGRPTSQIWRFFVVDPVDSSRAMCKVCSQTFSRGRCQRTRGTSNLIKHLKKHAKEFDAFQAASVKSREERNSSLVEVPVAVTCLPQGVSQTPTVEAYNQSELDCALSSVEAVTNENGMEELKGEIY